MKQQKILSVITITLFLAVIYGFAVSFWIMPDRATSDSENRPLQTFPKISFQSILEGELSEDFNAYFTDQFPLRDEMLTIGGLTQIAMGQGESNGVLLGRGGQLAVRKFDAYLSLTERAQDTDYFSPDHIQNAVNALEALSQKTDIPLTVLPAPRTLDVAISAFDYPRDASDALHDALFGGLAQTDVDTLDLTNTYRQMYDEGKYIYYRTDHHWTTEGAYAAYVALMQHWGMANDILPKEAFNIQTVNDFYGTTWSRAGLSFVAPDTLEIWEMDDDDSYVMRDKGGNILQNGFIDQSYLDKKDKYGAFLSGTRSVLTINQEGVSKPKLLIARDSFASSLSPFLARHFDLVLVNLSGGMTHLSAYTKQYECERMLVLCNLENFVTSDCIVRIE